MTDTRPDPSILCFNKILKGNITYDGEVVPVLTTYPPGDVTPSISMSVDGGQVALSTYYEYNPDNNTKTLVEERERTMTLHFWANNIDEKDFIVARTRELITRAEMGDYHTCVNYDPTTTMCATSKGVCDAITFVNAYSMEGKCPFMEVTDPGDANYRNPDTPYHQNNIVHVRMRTRQNADQLTIYPEMYYSFFTIEHMLMEKTVISSAPFKDVGLGDLEVIEDD